MPVKKDWRWVKGAVFVPTNVVNEAQQWDEYDPAITDRELHYASVYGVNCVRVFLHYLIYKKKSEALLRDIEDFLTRADKYHIKVEFIFFDHAGTSRPAISSRPGTNIRPPFNGAHNSSWLQSRGKDVLAHYEENKDTLKAYVQDIVTAHRDDPRIAFWETYNEPAKDDAVKRLMADAIQWIHETGSTIPVTATSGEWFPGRASSDFLTFHDYNSSDWLPKEGSEALCTECMNRKDQSVASVVSQFRGRLRLHRLGAWHRPRQLPLFLGPEGGGRGKK